MERALWLLLFIVAIASGAQAVQFLGVELCSGSVDTSVVLPVGCLRPDLQFAAATAFRPLE